MDTPQSPLTSSEIASLLSLDDSDLATFLNQCLPDQQRLILKQLGAATGLSIKPEPLQMPLTPTPRQSDFLSLECEEALFGGAAGGGKSEALLMWLAQGIDVPGYSGIIFRKFSTDLNKSGDSLVAKSYRIYGAMGGTFNESALQWWFPSGALIELGALPYEKSVLNYQGNSYHRAAFDELTHFSLAQYEYITSFRLRRAVGFPVTVGVRASANPGGPGHPWVKARFITDDAAKAMNELKPEQPTPAGMTFTCEDRVFVPSRVADNPYLDVREYILRMSRHSNPVERNRMLNGDWSIMPDGLIKPGWLRDFIVHGDFVRLYDAGGKLIAQFLQSECRRFMTVDTAGSSKHRTQESKGKPHSYSVAAVWDYKHLGTMAALILRHVWRDRVGFVEMCDALRELQREWRASSIKVEDQTMGPDLWDVLRGELPIELVTTGGKDKVTRATRLLNMLSRGEVFLPSPAPEWRPKLEAEWLSWQGLEEETNDQVDVAAYAAMECDSLPGAVLLAVDPRSPVALPSGIGGRQW